MTQAIARACVMGHPVAHSRSPMLHGYWLRTLGIDGAYEYADVAPEKFETFFRGLKRNGFVGGNITKPHKEAAFRLVDRREPAADAIGAVNTVWYEGDALVGGNTDWLGIVLASTTIHPGWDASPGKGVVLGAGGSARASVYAFLRAQVLRRDRQPHARARRETRRANSARACRRTTGASCRSCSAEADVLINNTSLGMAGNPPLAIDLAPLKHSAIVYDVDLRAARNRTAEGREGTRAIAPSMA